MRVGAEAVKVFTISEKHLGNLVETSLQNANTHDTHLLIAILLLQLSVQNPPRYRFHPQEPTMRKV